MLKQFFNDVVIVVTTLIALFLTITITMNRESAPDNICISPTDCAPDPKQVTLYR